MAPIRTAPTFYRTRDALPLVTLLLAQTDLGFRISRPLTITEEIPHGQRLGGLIDTSVQRERYAGSSPKVRIEIGPSNRAQSRAVTPARQSRAVTPASQSRAATPAVPSQKLIPRPVIASEGESEVEDDDDDLEEDTDDLIPKPIGEAGRPNRGGYNLQQELDWSLEDFNKFKVLSPELTHMTHINPTPLQSHAQRLATEHLDVSKAYSFQSNAGLERVVSKVSSTTPVSLLKD